MNDAPRIDRALTIVSNVTCYRDPVGRHYVDPVWNYYVGTVAPFFASVRVAMPVLDSPRPEHSVLFRNCLEIIESVTGRCDSSTRHERSRG
jgi:hypothetical protein